ncbi:zinc-ribbon domain-containing protein [Methanobrevibacter sp.]|uniref:zinc ribbon domain-containing protein n=1 Tax=Methanobrevibacter sp. TaxID=66852 RepID=UPI00386F1366
MVKCSRCGVEIADSFDICPNCGNNLAESQTPAESSEDLKCPSCGESLKPNADFCSKCGTKVANDSNRCENCGSEVPDAVLFCPTCGAKVKQPQKTQQVNICRNCGFKLESDSTFCPECGTNIQTGEMATIPTKNSNQGFIDKININSIIKPTIVALVVSIILSIIGVLIGFSWISFIIAVILSVGFFAGLIDNEANAVVSGLFVGLILGFLENPIIQFCFGKLVARVYEWFFGSQIIFLVIVAVIVAYVSNMFLKSKIQGIVGDHLSWL